MDRKGIKTASQGVNFRSMLEARWAKLFTSIGWDWIYEPYECDGWIPDFLIQGEMPFLVEIKPCNTQDTLIEACFDKASRATEEDFLLCGSSPAVVNLCQALGGDGDRHGADDMGAHEVSPWHLDDAGVWIRHGLMGWQGYPNGYIGKEANTGRGVYSDDAHYDVLRDYIMPRWKAAGNAIQWKR